MDIISYFGSFNKPSTCILFPSSSSSSDSSSEEEIEAPPTKTSCISKPKLLKKQLKYHTTSNSSCSCQWCNGQVPSEMPAGTTPAQLKNTVINTWVETLEGRRKRNYLPIFSSSFPLSAMLLRTGL